MPLVARATACGATQKGAGNTNKEGEVMEKISSKKLILRLEKMQRDVTDALSKLKGIDSTISRTIRQINKLDPASKEPPND